MQVLKTSTYPTRGVDPRHMLTVVVPANSRAGFRADAPPDACAVVRVFRSAVEHPHRIAIVELVKTEGSSFVAADLFRLVQHILTHADVRKVPAALPEQPEEIEEDEQVGVSRSSASDALTAGTFEGVVINTYAALALTPQQVRLLQPSLHEV